MSRPPQITDADLEIQKRKWLMCAGKVGFKEFEKADKRATELGYSLYECPYCNKWHLSSRKKRI